MQMIKKYHVPNLSQMFNIIEISIRKYLFNAYEMAINGIPAKILMEINKKVMFLLFTKFEQEATVKLANPEPLSMFPAEFIQGKFL